MTINNKQLVSIRLNGVDLARVKNIAQRLRVRESDVMRFAIKSMLAKLAPLHDGQLAGSDLLPAFIELGAELTSYFELDSTQLGEIINENVHGTRKSVDTEDIALLAMLSLPEHYLYIKLRELSKLPVEAVGVSASLRQYLYEKYTRLVDQDDKRIALSSLEEDA